MRALSPIEGPLQFSCCPPAKLFLAWHYDSHIPWIPRCWVESPEVPLCRYFDNEKAARHGSKKYPSPRMENSNTRIDVHKELS